MLYGRYELTLGASMYPSVMRVAIMWLSGVQSGERNFF